MTREARSRPTTVDEYAAWNATILARHPVTRRSLLKGVAGAGGIALTQFRLAHLAFAAAGGKVGHAGIVISGRHLSFVSGEAGVLKPAIRVTAQLVSKTGSLPARLRAFVEYGEHKKYGHREEAEITHLVGQYAIAGGPVGSQFYVKAKMSRLQPDRVYHYRLRLSDGTVTGDAHFTTAPAYHLDDVAAPFTFTAFADVGTNVAPTDPPHARHADPSMVRSSDGTWPKGTFDNNYYSSSDPVAGKTAGDATPAITQTNLMSSQRPVFTLLAGDICYADPTGSGLPANDTQALNSAAPAGTNRYNPYVWDVFLRQIESHAAFTPWMFATGNHDMEALYGDTNFLGDSASHGYAGHKARLDLPKNGPSTCPSVYSFRYGNVGVISVDSNELSHELQTNTGYSNGAQLRWLTAQLTDWRSGPDAARVDFIVVFMHHCAFSTTTAHASDGGVRGALDPIVSTYQVDLVVQGHNHVLERTDPIRDGKRVTSAPDRSTIHPATDGTTYLCVGSGGRPRSFFRPAPGASAPAPAGLTPDGAQALSAGQRYRGYAPPGGANAQENNTETIDNSFLWTTEGTKVNHAGFPQGSKQPEVADWSQVRYDGYAFIAVDVVPAKIGATTTMTIRTLADALPGTTAPFTEIDRVTLARTAGRNHIG